MLLVRLLQIFRNSLKQFMGHFKEEAPNIEFEAPVCHEKTWLLPRKMSLKIDFYRFFDLWY